MPSSGNTSHITLLGLVWILSNWIVSKSHCSNVIILRYLRKGTWQGLFGGRKRSFILPSSNSWFPVSLTLSSQPAAYQSVSTLTTCYSCHLLLRLRCGWGEWPRALSWASLSGTKKPDFLSALKANFLSPQRCQINTISVFPSYSHSSRLGSAFMLLPSHCVRPCQSLETQKKKPLHWHLGSWLPFQRNAVAICILKTSCHCCLSPNSTTVLIPASPPP